MPIDLGNSPTGTPPTAEEKTQILSALGIGDAATRSGAENLSNKTLVSPAFSGTATGQLDLPTQMASSASSVMTRSLHTIEPLFSIGTVSRPPTVPLFGNSGTGSSASSSTGDRMFSLTSGTAVNGYGRASLFRSLTSVPSFSGAGIEFSRVIGVTIRAFNNTPNAANPSRTRLIIGGNGGVPATADANALTARGFGVELYNDTGTNQIRTFAHNGTTYSTGTPVSISPSSVMVFGAISDGTGNVSLIYINSWASRPSVINTQTGGPTTNGTSATTYVDLAVVNSSTGTPISVSCAGTDAVLYVA